MEDKIIDLGQSEAQYEPPIEENEGIDKAISANPNQIVYDIEDQTDGVIEVREISFQLRTIKYLWVEKEAPEPYTVKNGGTQAHVLRNCQNKYKEELDAETIRNLRVEPYTNVIDTQRLKKGDQFKIIWEEKVEEKDEQGNPDYEYYRIKETKIKKQVFVVARCTGDNGILKIKIHECLMGNPEFIFDNPVKFLDGEEEKDVIEFNIDGRICYNKEITLRPQSDEDLKIITDKFNQRVNQTAFLYFMADVTDTDDDVKYHRDKKEFTNEENERLVVHNRQVCPVDPSIRSHFVIHSIGANNALSMDQITNNTGLGSKTVLRSKAHKYIMDDGSIVEIWPFTEKNVWATKTESQNNLKGQMFHVELNYADSSSPSDAQYNALADLYIEAADIEDCWPIIVPHIEIDRGIKDGHRDPIDFDYNKFYEILRGKNIPIDSIPHFDHDRYWGRRFYKMPWEDDTYSWPPVLSGNPHLK